MILNFNYFKKLWKNLHLTLEKLNHYVIKLLMTMVDAPNSYTFELAHVKYNGNFQALLMRFLFSYN